jgi:hypothetical protein
MFGLRLAQISVSLEHTDLELEVLTRPWCSCWLEITNSPGGYETRSKTLLSTLVDTEQLYHFYGLHHDFGS